MPKFESSPLMPSEQEKSDRELRNLIETKQNRNVVKKGIKKPNRPQAVKTNPYISIPKFLPYILFIIEGKIAIVPP